MKKMNKKTLKTNRKIEKYRKRREKHESKIEEIKKTTKAKVVVAKTTVTDKKAQSTIIKTIEAKGDSKLMSEQLEILNNERKGKLEEIKSSPETFDAMNAKIAKVNNFYNSKIEIMQGKQSEINTEYSNLKTKIEDQNLDAQDTIIFPIKKTEHKEIPLATIRRRNKSARSGKKKVPMKSPETIIEIKDVVKYYSTGKISERVLNSINLEINKGDFVVLYGKSGSGKSTLLNIMSGLDRATQGQIPILGTDITTLKDEAVTRFRRINMGFIFQRYNLLPNLSAYENVETGSYLQKDASKRLDIKELFKSMDISDVIYKYPAEMSGGQQQRVSIARAVVKNPAILFADEPTGALDDKMSLIVLDILAQINKKYNTTIIMVSHNPIIADMATKVVTLKSGDIASIKINANPKAPSDLNW